MRQSRHLRNRQKIRDWKRSKKYAQREHAKRRALQRFGLTISSEDLKQIVKDIQDQKARFLRRESTRITVWEIDFRNKNLTVVYDNKRKEIVTFLPDGEEEMTKDNKGQEVIEQQTNLFITQLVDKWEQTGLLKHLNEEQQKEMSQKLESLTRDILDCGSFPPTAVNVLFPLQRKLLDHSISLSGNNILIDGKPFMETKEFLAKREEIVDLNAYNELDVDVEFVNAMFEEMKKFAEG